MTLPRVVVLACVLLIARLIGSAQTKVSFEAASIRPAAPQTANFNVGLRMDGAQAHFTYLSLRDYITTAYRLKVYQVVGPDWLSGKFDVAGKLPDGSSAAQIPEMLQSLLEERFALKMHREARDFPVYVLDVARGGIRIKELALKSDAEAVPEGTQSLTVTGTASGVVYRFGSDATLTFSQKGLEGHKIRMRDLADTLSWYLDKPVVDMTGLQGSYDIVLDVSEDDARAMSIRAGIVAGINMPPAVTAILDKGWGDSLRNALGKAGLTLESRKAPLDVAVIDSIRRQPTDN